MASDEPKVIVDYEFDNTLTLHELKQFRENRVWRAYVKSLDKLSERSKNEVVENIVDQAIDSSNALRAASLAAGEAVAFQKAKGIIDLRINTLEYLEKIKQEGGEEHGTS